MACAGELDAGVIRVDGGGVGVRGGGDVAGVRGEEIGESLSCKVACAGVGIVDGGVGVEGTEDEGFPTIVALSLASSSMAWTLRSCEMSSIGMGWSTRRMVVWVGLPVSWPAPSILSWLALA